MSILRRLGAGVLGILLTISLVTATAVGAAHSTVLDPGFTTDAIEEEGGYELVRTAAIQAASPNETNASSEGTADESTADEAGLIDRETVVREAVTEAYVRNQSEANIEALYAYLHGDTANLSLSISTDPIVQNGGDAIEAQLANASLLTLIERSGRSLQEPLDRETLAGLTANESSYQETRTTFRERIRERVVDGAVDRAFNQSSNDELLALVIDGYDPREYTAEEKARMVRERESEIRAALRTRIEAERGDEIDQRVDERLAAATSDLTAATPDSELGQAALEVQSVVAQGLAGDMAYDSFQQNLAAARDRLAQAAGDRARAQLDASLDDEISLSDSMPQEARDTVDTARTGVTWMDRLAFILPVAILGLLGGIYLVTRSVPAVLTTLGTSAIFAGLPTYVALGPAFGAIEGSLRGTMGADSPVLDLILGVLGQIFAVVGQWSLSLTVLGILALAIGIGLRRGTFERLGDRVRQRRSA